MSVANRPSTQVRPLAPEERMFIETDVPAPGIKGRSPLIGMFKALSAAPVGASFFIPSSICSVGGQIGERAHRVGGKGWVTIRKVEGGFRAWKIAEPKLRD